MYTSLLYKDFDAYNEMKTVAVVVDIPELSSRSFKPIKKHILSSIQEFRELRAYVK